MTNEERSIGSATLERTRGRRLDRTTLARAVTELARRDRDVRAVIRNHGPPPLWSRRPGFATLLRIILEQQVSLASGRAIYLRVRRALGEITPHSVLDTGTMGLRRLGVTRQKSASLIDAARRVDDGRLDLRRIARADDQTAGEELRQTKGVGPWTANIYLLMALGRPDIWPPGDVALLTALRHLRRSTTRPTDEDARRDVERWRPWRAVGARILWHGYLSGSLSNGRQ